MGCDLGPGTWDRFRPNHLGPGRVTAELIVIVQYLIVVDV